MRIVLKTVLKRQNNGREQHILKWGWHADRSAAWWTSHPVHVQWNSLVLSSNQAESLVSLLWDDTWDKS